MSYQNLLSINDNVFKFFSLLGIVLFIFGIIYPNDKLSEIMEIKSEAKFQENVLSLRIDRALQDLEKFNGLIKDDSTINVKTRDSIQFIADTTDYGIQTSMYQLEYQKSIGTFSINQFNFFQGYRYWIIFVGLCMFCTGAIFWIIFFVRAEKNKRNE